MANQITPQSSAGLQYFEEQDEAHEPKCPHVES